MLRRSLAVSVVASALFGQNSYTISTLYPSPTSPDIPLSDPLGLAISPSGDLIVADSGVNCILLVNIDGRSSRVTGRVHLAPIEENEPPLFSGDGGPATEADLASPTGVAVDAEGNIYVADTRNNRIRKITKDGLIQTIAGIGTKGFRGDGGPAVQAELASPMGLAVDPSGNIYIADRENNRVRKISSNGTIQTVIGSGKQGWSGNGPALRVRLNYPHGVALDAKGNLYVADTFNHCIRRLDSDGVVRIVAGTGKQEFHGDGGPATKAGLGAPDSLAIDGEGDILIADRANWRVREITPDGIIHTIAGIDNTGFYGDGSYGDGGAALSSSIFPTSVAIGAGGVIYVTDHDRVRRLTPRNPAP